MKISVIIPVYNVSKYIERCLLSVLNQTWEDMEVILVDDCTPDDSMKIAERVIASHVRGNIVKSFQHTRNRGLSAARNTGINEATGKYLYFLDSDDYLPDNSFQLFKDALNRNDVDFIIGNYKIMGGNRWAPSLFLPTSVIEGNENILSTYVRDKWYVMAWNKLVNRNFLLKHQLFFQEGIVHEDDLWSFKLACVAQRLSIVHEITYYYFVQPNSIMRAPSLFNLECRVAVIGYMLEYIQSFTRLKHSRDIYIYFENLKAKYFDRILYYSKDHKFRYKSYMQMRGMQYFSFWKALKYFCLAPKMTIRNFHYILPHHLGYYYFVFFVRISYLFLVLPIKLKIWYHKK